jgi:hypothetical protein
MSDREANTGGPLPSAIFRKSLVLDSLEEGAKDQGSNEGDEHHCLATTYRITWNKVFIPGTMS